MLEMGLQMRPQRPTLSRSSIRRDFVVVRSVRITSSPSSSPPGEDSLLSGWFGFIDAKINTLEIETISYVFVNLFKSVVFVQILMNA